MKERSIIFSGPLIRAILDGRKTQTRRLLRRQPDPDTVAFDLVHGRWRSRSRSFRVGDVFPGHAKPDATAEWTDPVGICCPYGAPGDRLWVRETWSPSSAFDNVLGRDKYTVFYRADNAQIGGFEPPETWKEPVSVVERQYAEDLIWVPSIYMPRWASRIDLENVEVRVQRIQDISEEDARAEGLPLNWVGDASEWTPEKSGWLTPVGYSDRFDECCEGGTIGGKPAVVFSAREALRLWWDHINGARPGGSWAANPWVWAQSFRRVQK